MAMTRAERQAHEAELAMYRQYVAIRPDRITPDALVTKPGDKRTTEPSTRVAIYCVKTAAGLESALAVYERGDGAPRLMRVRDLRAMYADLALTPEWTLQARIAIDEALAAASRVERDWLAAGAPRYRMYGTGKAA